MVKIKYLFCLTFLIFFTVVDAIACTVFFATNGTSNYGATNKDWDNLHTAVRVMPATEGKFGRVYFGYQITEGFQNTSGINERGLWYDGASLPERSDIKNYHNKPVHQGELCEKALEECATVEEVIALYKNYYTPHWQGHSMWADKYGNSVVFEFGENDVVAIDRNGDYQIITNHYLLNPQNEIWRNCYRYKAVGHTLKNMNELNLEVMKAGLKASHQTGVTPTVYSNIYDLNFGKIYTFNFHNYNEMVEFSVEALLNGGDQTIALPDLFNNIEIISPKDVTQPSEVSLKWLGDAADYEVHYADNRSFENATILNTKSTKSNTQNLNAGIGIGYGLFLISFVLVVSCKPRKPLIHLLSILTITALIFSLSSCYKTIINPYPKSNAEHTINISGLKNNQEYFWKVVGINQNNFNSESTVASFYVTE